MPRYQTPFQTTDDSRIEWMKSFIDQNWERLKHLDIGCGNGIVCKQMADQGAKSIGIDIIDASSQATNWNFRSIDLCNANWAKSLDNETFNIITAFDIIEHLSDPVIFLNNIKYVMTTTSKLFITTPNTSSWERFYNSTGWSGAADPQHLILFNSYSLQFLLQKCGFKVLNISAPIRRLRFLGPLSPNIGGQIQVIAQLNR